MRGSSEGGSASADPDSADSSLRISTLRTLAGEVRSFSRDPRAYAQLREHLAARIETLLSSRKLGAAE